MGDKKYQIFVSSTYEDLKDERNLIIEHILTLGHMPVGMELFCASNDEQFEYIKKIIDDCDYYVLILGGRYGTISDKTGLSYTEMEYRYAIEKNIPVLIFPYQNIDELPSDKKDKSTDAIYKFREEVSRNRVVKFWSTHSDLTAGVLVALTKQFQDNPRQGWQRFEDKSNLMEENRILRKEKDELIKENQELKQIAASDKIKIENIAELNEKYSIKFVYQTYQGYNSGYTKHNAEVNTTWNEIFSYIAPYLIQPITFYAFKSNITSFIKFKSDKSVHELDDEYVQTIKIQLFTQKLINVYSDQAVKGGIVEWIEITPKGLKHLQEIKTIKSLKD